MTQSSTTIGRPAADVPFSHRDAEEDRALHCLVCWGYGGTVRRHRGRSPHQTAPASAD
ncbi:MAG: hypothetical protein JWO22_494 [Frankiales bacterium]|nr:hypothetical protein [Frankiales bacterium]